MADLTNPWSSAIQAYGTIPSSGLNYINVNFPNLLNRAGGNITGTVTVTNTGSLIVASGGTFTIQNGANATISSFVDVSSTGSIIFQSGSTLDCAAGCTVDLIGATGIYGTTTVESGGTLSISSGGTLALGTGVATGMLTFSGSNGNCAVAQATGTGVGSNLTVAAQTTVTAGDAGGNLLLNSGQSGSGGALSNVVVNGVYFNSRISGAPNTQTQQFLDQTFVLSTTASGSDADFFTITASSTQVAGIKVNFALKQTPSPTAFECDEFFFRIANAYTSSLFPSGGYSGGTTIANYFSVRVSGSSVILTAKAQTYAADWQIRVTTNLC